MGLIVVLAAGVLVVKTPDGTIVIENLPENAVIEVDGERVVVTPVDGKPIEIPLKPGKHGVVVKRGDVFLAGESVTIESGKDFKLIVRRDEEVKSRPSDDTARHIAEIAATAPRRIWVRHFLVSGYDQQLDRDDAQPDSGRQFMMGSPDADKDAAADEKPRHRVRITRPFYLGVYEVTQAQYRAVIGTTQAGFRRVEEVKPRSLASRQIDIR